MTEHIEMKGCLSVCAVDLKGRGVFKRQANNLITAEGKEAIAKIIAASVENTTGQQTKTNFEILVAKGSDKVEEEDTLETMIGTEEEKKLHLAVAADIKAKGRRITVSATLPALKKDETLRELTEAGIRITHGQKQFLYNHVSFPVITRSENIKLNLTWEVEFL